MVPEWLSTKNIIDVEHDVTATVPCITDEDILEQFQTHQAESDEGDNGFDYKTVNELHLITWTTFKIGSRVCPWCSQKCCPVRNKTGDEMQSFLLRLENLFSKEKYFA